MALVATPQHDSGPKSERVSHDSSLRLGEFLRNALRVDSPFVRFSRAVTTAGGGVVAGLSFGALGGIAGGVFGAILFALTERRHQ